jgi:NodT family efflux transporter outer membrane factor (OMF) lipoprotein
MGSPTFRPIRLAMGLAVLCFATAGCTTSLRQWYCQGFKVGPNYSPPAAPVADRWIDAGSPNLRTEPEDSCSWWAVFRDPVLNALVETASRQNLPLQIAAMRIAAARAERGVAAGNLFPQKQEMTGQYSRNQFAKNSYPFGEFPIRLSYDDWSTGLAASWELDFWGRFRRALEAANANLEAQIDNYGDVLVILEADVATNYIQMRAFEERLVLAKKNADLQRRTLNIAQARFKAGVVTELDVQQAATALAITESLVPTLEAGRRRAQNRLCVLMGVPPADLAKEIGSSGAVPSPPREVVVGIPADLLRRRPDVRRAEREAAAQSARIGIAEADFYPRLAIAGTIDLDAQYFSRLLDSGSLAGSVGPNFRWDILNYGRIRNNVRAQQARFQQAVLAYRDAVLRANEEAENAIVDFLREQVRVEALKRSEHAAVRSVELAMQQYEKGVIDYQPLLDAERVLVQQQDTLTESRALVAVDLVAVYRALAGGWTTEATQ